MVKDLVTENIDGGYINLCEDATKIIDPHKSGKIVDITVVC